MPKKYFYNAISSSNEVSLVLKDNIFKRLLDYYYNILPFPKKICSIEYISNNEISCYDYEYVLINLGKSYTYMKNTNVSTIIKEKSCS